MSEQNKKFIVKNVAEDLVDMYIDDCIKSSGMCTCERCKADVKAFALNTFPPKYVVTDIGEALARTGILSNQFEADMITALMSGIILVKKSPRH
jgi:competence protein ComFB